MKLPVGIFEGSHFWGIKEASGRIVSKAYTEEDAHLIVQALNAQQQPLRNQPCGCVLCICDTEDRCLGCGAKMCEKHQGIGHLPEAEMVYAQQPCKTCGGSGAVKGEVIEEGQLRPAVAICPDCQPRQQDCPSCQQGGELVKELRNYIKGRYPPHRVLTFGTKELDASWNKDGEWLKRAAARIVELEKLCAFQKALLETNNISVVSTLGDKKQKVEQDGLD